MRMLEPDKVGAGTYGHPVYYDETVCICIFFYSIRKHLVIY